MGGIVAVVTAFGLARTYSQWRSSPVGRQLGRLMRKSKAVRREERKAEMARMKYESKMAKRQHRKDNRAAMLASMSKSEKAEWAGERRSKRERLAEGLQRLRDSYSKEGPALAIDLRYRPSQRHSKWRTSIGKQISNSYAIARRSPTPLPIHITSADDELKASVGHTWEIDKWPLQWSPERPEDMWAGGKDKVVYLSPDSPNVLESLEEGVLYVIGGIIDQTVRPGMSLKEASKASVRHARLPVEAATGRSAEVEAARRELGPKLGPSNLGRAGSGSGSGSSPAAGEYSGEQAAKEPTIKSSVSAADGDGRMLEFASDGDDKEGASDAIGAGPAAPAGKGGVRPSAGAHKRVVLNIDHVVLAITEFREHGSWPKALVRALPARVLRKYWIDAEPSKKTKAPAAASSASGTVDQPSSGDGSRGVTTAKESK